MYKKLYFVENLNIEANEIYIFVEIKMIVYVLVFIKYNYNI